MFPIWFVVNWISNVEFPPTGTNGVETIGRFCQKNLERHGRWQSRKLKKGIPIAKIIIAHKNVNSLSNQELIANSQNIISAINTEEIIKKRYTENLDLSDSIIITDDYAPVMDLLNPVTGKLLIKEIIVNNGTISKIENVTQPII